MWRQIRYKSTQYPECVEQLNQASAMHECEWVEWGGWVVVSEVDSLSEVWPTTCHLIARLWIENGVTRHAIAELVKR